MAFKEYHQYYKSYKRFEDEWKYCITPLHKCKIYDPDPFEVIKANNVDLVPNGTKVYVPKHVKYPRSYLRDYLKSINSRIVLKPENADVAVFDPVFFNENPGSYRSSRSFIAKFYDPVEDKEMTLYANLNDLARTPYAFSVQKEVNFVIPRDSNYIVEGYYNLASTVNTNKSLNWITYDNLHQQVCGKNKIEPVMVKSIAEMMFADDSSNKTAQMFLGTLSRFAREDNYYEFVVLLYLMQATQATYRYGLKTSTFFHNVLNRYPVLYSNELGGYLRNLDPNSAYGVGMRHTSRSEWRSALAASMCYVHNSAFAVDKKDFPEWMIEYYTLNNEKSCIRWESQTENLSEIYADGMLKALKNYPSRIADHGMTFILDGKPVTRTGSDIRDILCAEYAAENAGKLIEILENANIN